MQKKIAFSVFILLALISFSACSTSTTKAIINLKIASNQIIDMATVGNNYEFTFVVEYGQETWTTPDDHINSGAFWWFDEFTHNSNPSNPPIGLTFEDGTIEGTPDPADLGLWSFEVTVEHKKHIAVRTFYLIISRPLEIITDSDLGSTVVDEYFTTSFNAIFGSTPYFWSIDNYEHNGTPAPNGFAGLVFYSSGVLSGTPVHNDIGIWTFDVTVFDSSVPNQQNDTASFTLQVKESLTVPLYYATIQDAIDAANNGDVVKVLDGTFQGDGNRNLTFRGKKITVRGNVTDPSQVIIDCEGSSSDMHRGFIFNNKETLDSVVEGFTVKNAFHTVGGTVAIDRNAGATFRNMIFEDNKAEDAANHVWGGVIYVNQTAEVSFYDCIFRNNEATITPGNSRYVYGGLINAENNSVIIMENCTFENNTTTAWYTRALFRFNYAEVTMDNCTINNNTITSTNSTHFGLFDANYANVTMNDTVISNNSITADSGTHYGIIGYINRCTWTMNNCQIVNNQSSTTGWGTHYGLFGYPYYTTLTIDNTIISGNEITNGSTNYGYFGYAYFCNLTFKNSSMSNNTINNTSTTYGSYLMYATTVIENSTFSGNVTRGSTVYGGVLTFNYGSLFIDSSSFINNQNIGTSTANGGAIDIWRGPAPIIVNSVFAYNRTTRFGGAINMRYTSTYLDVINCTFYKNHADYYGGGLYTYGYCNIYNSIIWDNNAGFGMGHQVYRQFGTTILEYTCYRNIGNDMWGTSIGTGCITTDPLFVDTGTNNLTGNITFTQNSTTVTGEAGVSQFLTELKPDDMIYLDADGNNFATTVRNVISDTELELDGVYKGTAAAAGGATAIKVDLRLQNGSPCIDAGSDTYIPSGVTTDRDGNTRIVGTVDMGAYEVQ